jgi:hypothetical protein
MKLLTLLILSFNISILAQLDTSVWYPKTSSNYWLYHDNNASDERISDSFLNSNRQNNPNQIIKKQPGIKEILNNKKNKILKKTNRNNKISGNIFYKPSSTESSYYDGLAARDKWLYTYDKSGNCLSDIRRHWLNNTWVLDEKGTYTYDNMGNQLTSLSDQWLNNAWVNSNRITNTYDKSDNQLTHLTEWWSNNEWINSERLTYNYNDKNNELSFLWEHWINGAWVNMRRFTYSYDESGNCIASLCQTGDNGEWVNQEKDSYTFDNSGNNLTYNIEFWTEGVWQNSRRGNYTYDNNGNSLSGLFEQWKNDSWEGVERYTSDYDNAGDQIKSLNETYSDGKWVNSYLYLYSYDNNEHKSVYTGFIWTNDAWKNYSRYSYIEDMSGNRLYELLEGGVDSSWVNVYKDNYTYSVNGNCIHAESLKWDCDSWIAENGLLQLWYNNNQEYLIGFREVNVEYESFSDNIDENFQISNLTQNYPNPFNPITSIDFILAKDGFANLSLYNITGSKVAVIVNEYKQAGSYSIQFNASNLPSGVYFYKLEGGQSSQVKKMILIK